MRPYFLRFALSTTIMFTAFALALLIPAGTLSYAGGWAFLALFFGFYISIHLWLSKYRPALFMERTRFGTSDQQGFDKLLFPGLLLFTVGWLAFMSFDATRFHWSPLPVWVQWIGALILIISFVLLFFTFRENPFLATVVRVQGDRGQTVVSTGPYHLVRHPMYASMLLLGLGTPLVLGSALGLLVGIGFVAILMRRAVLEEKTLQEYLPGYKEYMGQVRYRMIPLLW